jgi:hypothetical protein
MHPDPSIAIGRTYQRELLRHAEVGRRAAQFKTSKHSRAPLALPRISLARRAGAIRATIASA